VSTLILRTTARLLIPLLLLFSLFLLIRGHSAPGGGFVGGLVASGAFALHMLAFDASSLWRTLRFHPRALIAFGLGLATAASALPVLTGAPMLTALWTPYSVGAGTEKVAVGTPLVFDVGVYLVVIGASLTPIFALEREQERAHGRAPAPPIREGEGDDESEVPPRGDEGDGENEVPTRRGEGDGGNEVPPRGGGEAS
jgi:multicomponent Na+:H+ antiporter subunit B